MVTADALLVGFGVVAVIADMLYHAFLAGGGWLISTRMMMTPTTMMMMSKTTATTDLMEGSDLQSEGYTLEG